MPYSVTTIFLLKIINSFITKQILDWMKLKKQELLKTLFLINLNYLFNLELYY